MLLDEIQSGLLQEQELTDKARNLGIDPAGMDRGDLIRAIQQAEGNTPCFDGSKDSCPYTQCCFYCECLAQYSPDQQGELKLSQKVPFQLQVSEECLLKGTLVLPPRFRSFLGGTNTIHVLYDGQDELMPYDERTGLIEGLAPFYNLKQIKSGERVHVQLRAIDPTYLLIARSW